MPLDSQAISLPTEIKRPAVSIFFEFRKIHVIFGLCCKVISFRDLSILLHIALEFSRSNPKHLETNFVTFSHKVQPIFMYTKLQ